MPRSPRYEDGLSRSARDDWSGERRTPSIQEQVTGFYIGIVMDDFDDQRLGQLWVYIPGLSARRFENESVPSYGGTVPDRNRPGDDSANLDYDQELRLGWIQCMPMFPFFGSDDYRVKEGIDTDRRNSEVGDVVSYGWWSQPRNGDHVGILFAHGDIAKGFWIGCIPKFSRNFMVPGSPGRPPEDFSDKSEHATTVALKNAAPDEAGIPALDKARHTTTQKRNADGTSDSTRTGGIEVETESPLAATDFAFNLRESGLLCDPLRGAGSSSSRRESPSYVTGFKSQGWSFDSEKNNLNNLDPVTMGAVQRGKRFSASSPVAGGLSTFADVNTTGHQLVFDDHPDCQGIRIRTSAGSQIYFNDSCNEPYIYISTAKGNVWIELSDEGTMNVYGKGSASFHFEEDMNFTAGRNINFEARGDMNVNVRGNYIQNIDGDATSQVSGGFTLGLDSFELKTVNAATIEAGTDISLKAGSEFKEESGANFSVTASGVYREQATQIFMNSGAGSPADIVTDPTIFELIQVPRIPTPDEISVCREPEAELDALATTVPQHQPWPGRCGNTRGFRAFADESEASINMRGSSRPDSNTPLLIIGLVNGVPALHVPNNYQTSSLAEEPSYTPQAVPAGALNPVATYTTSERMKNFIKRFEAFSSKAYLDAGVRFAIGFGHTIIEGDTINGDKFQGVVDQSELRRLRRTKGDLRIDRDEANRLFDLDLQKFEQGVKDNVTVDITQGQFDAMISFSYNVGVAAFSRSRMLTQLNGGNAQNVPNEWMKWSKSNNPAPPPTKTVNTGLLARRRDELEQFFVLA